MRKYDDVNEEALMSAKTYESAVVALLTTSCFTQFHTTMQSVIRLISSLIIDSLDLREV